MKKKIGFQFISSGDGASYSIIAWGQPIHGARIEIRSKACPLYYPNGVKRFNYTESDYQKYVIDTCGYISWHLDGLPSWDVVRAFNDYLTEQNEQVKRRHPELEMGQPKLANGRWGMDPTDWETVIIENLPE